MTGLGTMIEADATDKAIDKALAEGRSPYAGIVKGAGIIGLVGWCAIVGLMAIGVVGALVTLATWPT